MRSTRTRLYFGVSIGSATMSASELRSALAIGLAIAAIAALIVAFRACAPVQVDPAVNETVATYR